MVRTAAKGMSRCRARGGQPSTPAMPLNDSSQGAPPSAAARAASDLGRAGCKRPVARQVSQRLYRLYREVMFSDLNQCVRTHTYNQRLDQAVPDAGLSYQYCSETHDTPKATV